MFEEANSLQLKERVWSNQSEILKLVRKQGRGFSSCSSVSNISSCISIPEYKPTDKNKLSLNSKTAQKCKLPKKV
jgi:hypothetical protein